MIYHDENRPFEIPLSAPHPPLVAVRARRFTLYDRWRALR
jgi:hypothetical protein